MIRARNRKLSMILVLAMLMTMFAGLGTAGASTAVTYSAVNAPIVSTSSSFQTVDAQVLIDVGNTIVFDRTYDSVVTVQLPSNVEIKEATLKGTGALSSISGATTDTTPSVIAQKSTRVIDITIEKGDYSSDEGKLLLTFTSLKIKNGSGDIVATFLAPSGSAFPNGTVTIASIGKGKVMVLGGNVKNIGDGIEKIDGINLAETGPGVFEKGEIIKFELSKGFDWVSPGVVAGGWGFEKMGSKALVDAGQKTIEAFDIVKMDERVLEVKLNNNFAPENTAGRISLGTDIAGDAFLPKIQATDEAKEGDVTVTVSSTNIDKTKVVVAKYGAYDVKVVEGTTEEVLAGRDNEEIGEFYIEELVAGSLIPNRTVIFELPSGAKWAKDSSGDPVIAIDIEDGDDVFGTNKFTFVAGSKDRAIKITVKDISKDASKILFEDAEIKLEPGFEGDIKVIVRGTAGAEGTVKVAEALLPVTMKAVNPTNIVIGAANQPVADIVIQENKDEAILDGANRNIVVGLDAGYRFSSKPTVKVTDGDLEIDSIKLINEDTQLKFNVKYSSNDASTITISDVLVTAFRTVPEGDVKAKLVGMDESTYNEAGTGEGRFDDATGSTALIDWKTDKSAGSVVIANCATPAAGPGVAEFRVDSNVYYVGGNAKVMDVAPYIKNDRTYVPMRFLAEMLGAEVVWDDAARTVTLTKGDDVAVFTIGSTSYTVNGATMTADVAPEIANDRTMLPARFVAEAFGAVVGWDAGTRTVLIQQ